MLDIFKKILYLKRDGHKIPGMMMVMYQSTTAAVKSSRHVMNVMVTAALRRRQTVRRVMTLTAEPLPHCYPLLLLSAPIRQIRVVGAARGRSAAIAT